jgi:hypothetical protein
MDHSHAFSFASLSEGWQTRPRPTVTSSRFSELKDEKRDDVLAPARPSIMSIRGR